SQPYPYPYRNWSPQAAPARPTPPGEPPGVPDRDVYLFNRIEFRNVRFHNADLTNFQFNNCTFQDVCFDGAMLNGAVVSDCVFRLHEEPSYEGVLGDFGRPLMAYGVRIQNPQYELIGETKPSQSATPSAPPPPMPVAAAPS